MQLGMIGLGRMGASMVRRLMNHGHRGTSFALSFNEWHVLAITQAICTYRKRQGIDGPLFLGIDTHALSEPARTSSI